MFAYIVRRILTTIPLLVVGTFLIYTFVSLANNPLDQLATCQNCGPEAFQAIIDEFDLDQPIPVRYGNWIVNAVQGDMGEARSAGGQPAFEFVIERAMNTARLAVPAFLIIATLAVALGVTSAVRQYSKLDYALTGFSFLGISLPTFVFGLLLQAGAILFYNETGMRPFYTQGIRTLDAGLLEVVRSHALPILTLVLVITAAESRFQRAAMLEVIHSDYIRTARAKGLPPRRVIFKHGLRNALIPLVTIWAIDFALLLSGSVVTETIFSWPGLGTSLLRAISQQDLNLMMGIVMVISLLVVTFNLIADLLYGVLDPRIRYE